jgi:hypothetical protein
MRDGGDMYKYILGLSGKSGTGKSTMARHLYYRAHPDRTSIYVASFANALRQELVEAFKDPNVDWGEKPTPAWMRNLLIAWGAARRAQSPEYWRRVLARTIYARDCRVVIIDDVRYKNEADWIRDAGGHVVRLECVPAPLAVSNDRSETELDDYAFDCTYTIPYGGLWDASKPLYDQYLRHRLMEGDDRGSVAVHSSSLFDG